MLRKFPSLSVAVPIFLNYAEWAIVIAACGLAITFVSPSSGIETHLTHIQNADFGNKEFESFLLSTYFLDPAQRAHVVTVMPRIAETADGVANPKVRAFLMRLLGTTNDPQFLELYNRHRMDPDYDVRLAVFAALTRLPGYRLPHDRSVEYFLELNDPFFLDCILTYYSTHPWLGPLHFFDRFKTDRRPRFRELAKEVVQRAEPGPAAK